jgi:hypothetical protein
MPAEPAKIVEKKSPSLTIRLGMHPIVYSVATILAIGSLVFFFAITPMVRMLQAGGSVSVADAQARSLAAKEGYDSQKRLVDAVAAISKDSRDLLAYALPDAPDAAGLAVQLNSIAIKSGVRMMGIDAAASPVTSGSTTVPQTVKPLSIAYTVDGISYDKLKILLSNLEYSLRIFDVMSLNFSPTAATVSMQLRTYYITKS